MSSPTSSEYSKSDVKIPSVTPSWNLDAWKYLPRADFDSAGKLPVIVMAHGFAANKLMGLAPFAEIFASTGYAVVAFDYRRWGASDGTPRDVLNVSDQIQDWRTVIKWSRQQQDFDPQKVILWGSSFSGGHVISLAAEDGALAAAIGQCPFTSGIATSLSLISGIVTPLKMVVLALADVLKQLLGLPPIYIPAAAEPGEVGGLTTPGTLKGWISVGGLSHSPNRVTASTLFQIPFYSPLSHAHKIACPLLLVISTEDTLCPTPGAHKVVARAQRGEKIVVPGDHFAVYPGNVGYNAAIQAELAFLQKHVPV